MKTQQRLEEIADKMFLVDKPNSLTRIAIMSAMQLAYNMGVQDAAEKAKLDSHAGINFIDKQSILDLLIK